jgi:DNA-binding beta-propeller fold protein YncE
VGLSKRCLRWSAALVGAAVTVAAAAAIDARRPALARAARPERHLLYVASPGVRNYVEHGGVGILVFDRDAGYRFVKRIPTFDVPAGLAAENVKGIAASAATGRLYVTTPKRMAAIDLVTEKMLWNREYEMGCDRMAIAPDGRLLYVPSFEGPHWRVVDGATGDSVATVVTDSGAHNTVYGPDGAHVYLAGLRSPFLRVADARTHVVVGEVGPFGNRIRPFTINGDQSLAFVNVNELLGFEVGDIRTGKVRHRVEVTGYAKGPVKRHGCPSHGIALTPDGREVWLADAANNRVHVFDAAVMPPRQVASIALRDQPGWVTFSLDGRHAYPSTGEVIDAASRRVVAALEDEMGRAVQSEKLLEIVFADGRPVRAGDQFGVGRGDGGGGLTGVGDGA